MPPEGNAVPLKNDTTSGAAAIRGPECTCCRSSSIAAYSLWYHLRTDVSGAHTAIIAPAPNTKTNLEKKSKRKHGNQAGDTTQPTSGQHPNWVPNATARRLGSLLSGLFSTYSICGGGVHANIIPSMTPGGTQKEKKNSKAKGKSNLLSFLLFPSMLSRLRCPALTYVLFIRPAS